MNKRKLLLLLMISVVSLPMFSQVYMFRNFSREEGLPQPFIYTLDQTSDGYLWVGTGEGLARFDGTNFTTFRREDGLAEDFVTSSCLDARGNLWLGHNQGGVSYFNGTKFTTLKEAGEKGAVTAIRTDNKGNTWISYHHGSMTRFSDHGTSDFKNPFEKLIIYSFESAGDELLVCTNNGLLTFNVPSSGEPVFTGNVAGLEGMKINFIKRRDHTDNYWVGTDKNGLFELRVKQNNHGANVYKVVELGPELGLARFNIISVTEDRYHNLWLSTFGDGVVQLVGSKLNGFSEVISINTKNGFSGDYVRCVFEDREYNLWVGTYGNGLSLRTNDYFAFFDHEQYREGVSSVSTDGSLVWTGGKGNITCFPPLNRGRVQTFILPQEVMVRTFYFHKDGSVWAGTSGHGVWRKASDEKTFKPFISPDDLLTASITAIVPGVNEVFISTQGGILEVSADGKLLEHYTTMSGLAHNHIYDLSKDGSGKIWIAGSSGVVQFLDPSSGVIGTRKLPGEPTQVSFNSILPAEEGIWLSTYGNGLYLVTEKEVINFDTRNGLGSNYCYGVVADKRGYVWVLHRTSLSRVGRGDKSVTVYSPRKDANEEGFLSAEADKYGNVWFASGMGLVRYSPDRDRRNTTPPVLKPQFVFIDDNPFLVDSGIPELSYDTYKVRFEVKALSLRNPEGVRYRYKLEGFDRDWSEYSKEPSISYTRLPDGDYVFVAEAFNADGIKTGNPLKIPFVVGKPFWKKWWFGLLLLGGIAQSIFFMIRFREKKHREIKDMLENMLQERTREVTLKKNELERKNKDITDSIAYARRIQHAILPPSDSINKYYPGSFIFYQPKDIVSGDFYWMKKFSNKLLIACADATGHGVPGAFMSLIGSTLLKDITDLNDVHNPAEVLDALDNEVTNTLSQHGTGTNDGMDMSLCEFDLHTNLLRFGLAMRPLVLIRNGVAQMYRGDRKAIGGKHNYSEGPFTCHSLQLEKGDTVFMFTDGFHDQFGGVKGKKLKLRPFIKLLEEISLLPPETQGETLGKRLNTWKGAHEQVDDILVIGVRV